MGYKIGQNGEIIEFKHNFTTLYVHSAEAPNAQQIKQGGIQIIPSITVMPSTDIALEKGGRTGSKMVIKGFQLICQIEPLHKKSLEF